VGDIKMTYRGGTFNWLDMAFALGVGEVAVGLGGLEPGLLLVLAMIAVLWKVLSGV
jgi:hypothetical protein